MKNYILALVALFFSSVAYAESYLVFDVANNTRVIITNGTCLVKGFHGSRAVVQRDDGAYIQGCWEKIDNDKHVKILWNNPAVPGDFAVIPLNQFYPVEK
jgi:hypothetical protein